MEDAHARSEGGGEYDIVSGANSTPRLISRAGGRARHALLIRQLMARPRGAGDIT